MLLKDTVVVFATPKVTAEDTINDMPVQINYHFPQEELLMSQLWRKLP